MSKNLAYLALGSNIEPEHNLPAAAARLGEYGRVRAASSAWESAAEGSEGGPHFLNAAVLLETAYGAAELRAGPLGEIEAALGRVRTADKNAPRPIDIDIMLFNRDILDLPGRHIPDPEIYERAFVAVPLAEIAPDYVHPETGETLAIIAARLSLGATGLQGRADVKLPGPGGQASGKA